MIEVYNKVAYTNPFPGLRSFEREDSYLFFGRDNQIRDLKEKLTYSRFLAIVGSSGSGKSSLVKAGLIPHLVDSGLASSRNRWQIVFFNPEATPIHNFARALYQTFSETNRQFATSFTPEAIESLLRSDPNAIVDWYRDTNLMIVIDQFEELFRYQQTEINRVEVTSFINLILDASSRQDYEAYVVLTMRSDYLDDCTDYEGLTEAINHGYYLLPKMNKDEIRQAITTPIHVMGASISDALITRILRDIGDKADQLPILQHALMRTWNHWQLNRTASNLIDIANYEAIGTMQKAITLHAEEVYADLADEKSQRAVEKLFKALIVLGEGDAGVIRPASVESLTAITGVAHYLLIDVLNRFREPGVAFLTPIVTVHADPDLIIDISHERIMNLWDRLQTWVKEETESAKFYKQVSSSAMLYHEGKTGLWANPELQIGLKWLAENRPTQAWANRYDPYLERAVNFLEYSRDQFDFDTRNKEQRQKNELRRARFFAIFLGIGALISLLFLIVSAVLRTQAKQSEEEALAEKKIALFERNRAEEQTREAVTQKKIAEQQEIIAEQQRRLTEEQRVIAVREQQTADEKRKEAEAARSIAVEEQKRANVARQEAEKQRQQAQLAQQYAELQKGRAQESQKEAESQRTRAVSAQKFAEQQRGKAIARSVAIQSYQMSETNQNDLPALLALEAYNLNVKNGGQTDNPDIFNALAKAADTRTVLRKHTDIVRTVAIQPGSNDQVIASGSDDGTVKLWDYTHPAQPLRSFNTPGKNSDGIRAVAFGKDGKILYGASEKGIIYRWETSQATGKPTAVKANSGPIQALLFSDDFSQLIAVGSNGHISLWNPGTNRLDSLRSVYTGLPIYCARMPPDGKQLVCGSNNSRIVRFDLTDLKKPPVVINRREFGNRITALAFSPDGKQLITGNAGGQIYAWTISNNTLSEFGSLLSGRHTSTVNDIAFSPNGKFLASCSADWSMHIWDYSNLSQQQQPIVINDFDSWVMSIRFTSDNKRLIASSADKTIRVRNVNTADLYAELTRKVKRNLTAEEWDKYIGKDIPYENVKPE
ncbi:hypothetical protein WBJ53_08100 [Spirosoma sp. SC4-14]|uniref:nSTAND1 domain-containing NTPase n=1 Tax=Spirosoma sp. SC4-14 TaxID=3128900 RepID=UPI0030D48824